MAWSEWAVLVGAGLAVAASRYFYKRTVTLAREVETFAAEAEGLRRRCRELSLALARHEQAAHFVPLRLSQERRLEENR